MRRRLRLHHVPLHHPRGFDSLEEADELEEDFLDRAWGLEAQSRLACQAIVGEEDLTVEIPKYSLNHAAEAPH